MAVSLTTTDDESTCSDDVSVEPMLIDAAVRELQAQNVERRVTTNQRRILYLQQRQQQITELRRNITDLERSLERSQRNFEMRMHRIEEIIGHDDSAIGFVDAMDPPATYGEYFRYIYERSELVTVVVNRWNERPLCGTDYIIYNLICDYWGDGSVIWAGNEPSTLSIQCPVLFELQDDDATDSDNDYLYI